MAAQEYYTSTPPNSHLPSTFNRPPTQSQPYLHPNTVPPRRSSNPPYLGQRPQRGSFGAGGSQPPPMSRPNAPGYYNNYPPPPGPASVPSGSPYQQPYQPQIFLSGPQQSQYPFPAQQPYNPNIPISQLPQPYPNHAMPSTHRPPQTQLQRRPSEPFESDSSDSESYHSDPEHHRRRRHHHHDRDKDGSRSRSRGLNSSKSPRPRHRTARHNSDAWIGGVGGALIGDILFPGLGTVGGAAVGALQGHHYDKKRIAREDAQEALRQERRHRRQSGGSGGSRGRRFS
jgi:hypothetical protein